MAASLPDFLWRILLPMSRDRPLLAACGPRPMSAFYWNLRQGPTRFGESAIM
jgi:hypothetical protein